MADEAQITGDESGATVTLAADTSPFENALNKAAEKAKGWAGKVTAAFETVNTLVSQKAGEFKEKVSGLGGLSSQDIGATLGGGLGAAIGVWFGGPAGAALGSKIGLTLGDQVGRNFDLTGMVAAAGSAIDAVADLGKGVGEAWTAATDDASSTFGRIKEQIGTISFRDIFQALFQDNADASAKIAAVWESVSTEISMFFDRGLARVAGALDSVWAKVKEPVAKVADFIQGVLVKIGLVDKGTQSWGDSIRSIEKTGKTVLGALAYAFGYLEGVMIKVGGHITEWVVVPVLEALQQLYTVLADAAKKLSEMLPEGFAKDMVDKYEDGTRGLSIAIDVAMNKLKRKAEEWKAVDIGGKARAAQEGMFGRVDEGERQNWVLDQMKKVGDMGRAMEGAFYEFNRRVAGAADVVLDRPLPVQPEAVKLASAMLAESKEATNTIIRSTAEARGGPAAMNHERKVENAAETAAKQREAAIQQQKAMLDRLEGIENQLRDAMLVKQT